MLPEKELDSREKQQACCGCAVGLLATHPPTGLVHVWLPLVSQPALMASQSCKRSDILDRGPRVPLSSGSPRPANEDILEVCPGCQGLGQALERSQLPSGGGNPVSRRSHILLSWKEGWGLPRCRKKLLQKERDCQEKRPNLGTTLSLLGVGGCQGRNYFVLPLHVTDHAAGAGVNTQRQMRISGLPVPDCGSLSVPPTKSILSYKVNGCGNQVRILALPPTSCVTLGKLLDLSGP